MGYLRSLAASIATASVVAACGAAGGDEITERAPPEGSATLLATVAPEDEVVGPAPSSTVPAQVDPLYCTEEPVTIAERTLVARRQGAPSPGCASFGPDQVPSAVCWTECPDGTMFVDFDLDPQMAVTAAPGTGADVRYVAVYRTPDQLERRAETLVLVAGDAGAPNGSGGADTAPGSWTVSAVVPVDLSTEVDAAEQAAGRYLEAIASGDVRVAADLLLAGGTGAGERPDFARLVDEGLLDVGRPGPDELARALAGWCEQAACGLPDDLRTEITPGHQVRAVATYETDLGPFDVVLDAGTADGQDFVRGLPPVLP
jgi:hypothetical protein